MIKVQFDFPCGATRIYNLMTDSIKGLRVNNNRPLTATIYDDDAADPDFRLLKFLRVWESCILPALHPCSGTIVIDNSAKYLFPDMYVPYLRGRSVKTGEPPEKDGSNGKTDTES